MFLEDKPVKKSIVEILTTNEYRTSVFAPKQIGRIVADVIGVNSVCQGKPISRGDGFYERGFVNPKNEKILYLINAEKKVIGVFSNDFNLFDDQDKVNDKNQYVWHGSFEEIVDEFKKANYKLVEGGIK